MNRALLLSAIVRRASSLLARRMSSKGTPEVLPTPEKPLTDKKEYRSLRLHNGLRALLISDTSYPLDKLAQEEEMEAAAAAATMEESEEEEEEEEEMEDEDEMSVDEEEPPQDDDEASPTKKRSSSSSVSGLKKSAAGICVGAGSFSDPAELPGLAHFVEHMVFMGSKKYPDENGFDNFIHNCGGYDNAHTDCETTVFYFDVQRRHFKRGLDQFAHFFVNPLMKQGSMQREREAVDSEFEQALPSDSNRREQLFGALAKEGHPMAKFMWGNLSSLQPKEITESEINKKLHAFKDRHYSARNVTLAVQSQETLDTLEEWVKESFGSVPVSGQDRESFGHLLHPFQTDRFHKVFKVAPIQNVYQLDLNWVLPPLLDKYRCKPLHYLSWIIGHEGKGSLISYLRKKVWALSLTAGNDGSGFQLNSTYSAFTVTIVLTKEGYRCLDKVLDATFGYLRLLRSSPPNERIFEEIRRIERLHFDFGEEPQPADNVESLAENMQYYPPELYISGDDLLFEFQPGLIRDCADKLVPEEVNVFISAKEVKDQCNKVEPWFGTRYSEENIPPQWLDSWTTAEPKPEMHLPEVNRFIAEDLSLKPIREKPPRFPSRVIEEREGELFFRQDDTFLKPLAYLQFFVCSPEPLSSLKDAVCLDLMVYCSNLVMVEETYPADLAQLSFSLAAAERGIMLKVSGLNDKLEVLLETILDNVVSLGKKLTEEQFRAVRDQTRRGYYNTFLKPMRLVREVRLSAIQDTFWLNTEKHSIVSTLEMSDMLAFATKITSGCFLQGLVQGNMTQEEAESCYRLVKTKLSLTPLGGNLPPPELRCCELPRGEERVLRVPGLNARDGNTVVTVYHQGSPGTLASHATLELANLIMEEPAFDVLRTREQLGYTVFSMLRNTHGVLGFSITVCAQACKFSPDHVDERIDKFLDWFLNEKMKDMTEEEFQGYVRTLVKDKRAADVTLSEEASRNWSEILSREYLFDRFLRDADNLESRATKSDVCGALSRLLRRGGDDFRKLSVQVVGNPRAAEAEGEAEADGEDEADAAYAVNCTVGAAAEEAKEGGDAHVGVASRRRMFVEDLKEFRQSLPVYPVLHIVE